MFRKPTRRSIRLHFHDAPLPLDPTSMQPETDIPADSWLEHRQRQAAGLDPVQDTGRQRMPRLPRDTRYGGGNAGYNDEVAASGGGRTTALGNPPKREFEAPSDDRSGLHQQLMGQFDTNGSGTFYRHILSSDGRSLEVWRHSTDTPAKPPERVASYAADPDSSFFSDDTGKVHRVWKISKRGMNDLGRTVGTHAGARVRESLDQAASAIGKINAANAAYWRTRGGS